MAIALRFGVAQRKARTGSVAPARQGRPAGSGLLAAYVEALAGWVEADGDITMLELEALPLQCRFTELCAIQLLRHVRARRGLEIICPWP